MSRLPDISAMQHLQELHVRACPQLDCLPDNLGLLTALTSLMLSG